MFHGSCLDGSKVHGSFVQPALGLRPGVGEGIDKFTSLAVRKRISAAFLSALRKQTWHLPWGCQAGSETDWRLSVLLCAIMPL